MADVIKDEPLDISFTEKKEFTPQEILSLRRANAERPKGMTPEQWMAPTSLSSQHELVAYMLASGQKKSGISEITGLSPARIAELARSERVKFRVKEIQIRIYGKEIHKRLEGLIDQAITTVGEILDDDHVKASTKLAAANTVFDRVMGKPKQQIEHKDTSLADFYEKLAVFEAKKNEPIEDAEFVEVENSGVSADTKSSKDEIDLWVENNL